MEKNEFVDLLKNDKIQNNTISELNCKNEHIENVMFENVMFENVDFSETYVRESNFRKVNMVNINFSKSYIEAEQLDFIGEFSQCNFNHSNILYIAFRDSKISNCDFENMRYKLGVFDSCITESNNFDGVEFDGSAIWGKEFLKNSMRNAKLDGGGFNHLKIFSNDFSKTNFEGYSISDSVVSECIFDFVSITNMLSRRTKYFDCDFNNAVIKASVYDRCEIVQCDFSESIIENVSYRKCKLKNLDFTKTLLKNITFEDCSFENTVFTEQQKVEFKV
ncbi:MAG: pentapeptide repeat-containing protein [Lachnospiraceae bacterium]|nr:pentapeptide repeat-containing protein [Lachnospiraceae bacterium]